MLIQPHTCCAPAQAAGMPVVTAHPVTTGAAPAGAPADCLDRRHFLMGTDEGFAADGEGPVRPVHVRPFRIDATAVTNAQFATFFKPPGTSPKPSGSAPPTSSGVLPARGGLCGVPLGGKRLKALAGDCRKGPDRRSGNGPATRSRRCRGTTPRPTAPGPARPANRGGMEQPRCPWGDELTPGWAAYGQHLAGHLPLAQQRRGRACRHRAGNIGFRIRPQPVNPRRSSDYDVLDFTQGLDSVGGPCEVMAFREVVMDDGTVDPGCHG
jgi:hypothetical protein